MAEPRQSRSAERANEEAEELSRLRREIDAIDAQLLERLNDRARVVEAVGRLKRGGDLSVYQPDRERRIVERLSARNPGPFPNAGLAPVYREIISATRSLEEVVRVAYLGPDGTFAHLAARERFGHMADLRGVSTIAEVFAAVERGKCELGVVPVENTTEGIVTASYDAFPAFEGTISGELKLRISHHLLSRSGALDDVRRVASHPQPLAQCRRWLDRHLPGVDRVETPSTAAAARLAAEDAGIAAIGSAIAAEVYGLEVAESAIEDRRDNTTRFLLIGGEAPEASGSDLTFAVFTLRKDAPGGLHELLEPFASRGVNLTSLQLRPMLGKLWEYLFFLEIEGHSREARVAEALEAAAERATSYRVLGSFPRAGEARGG